MEKELLIDSAMQIRFHKIFWCWLKKRIHRKAREGSYPHVET